MKFDASMVGPTLQTTSATLRDGALRLLPALVLATVSGVASDAVIASAPSYFALGNLVYAVVQLAVQAWVIAIALAVLGHDLGGRSTWRLGSLFVLSLLAGLGILIGFLALVLPGLYLAGRWFVAAPAMLVEGKSASEGLARSGELMERYWLSASIVTLLFLVFRFAPLVISGAYLEIGGGAFWAITIGSNLVSEAFGIASIVASVVLYLTLARPTETAEEIFG